MVWPMPGYVSDPFGERHTDVHMRYPPFAYRLPKVSPGGAESVSADGGQDKVCQN